MKGHSIWRSVSVMLALVLTAGLLFGTSTRALAKCQAPTGSTEKCQESASSRYVSGGGGRGLALDGYWHVQWYQLYNYTSSQIKYSEAYTYLDTGGPGREQVHGALVKDWGGNNDNIYVFGPIDSTTGFAVGGTSDSWHNIDGKTWLSASGHSYDDGDDGTIDATCDGCIDQVHYP